MKPICPAALVLVLAALPLQSYGQAYFVTPERFGVIDITPNNLSGESDQNDSPTLGVGMAANYGKYVVNANNSSLFAGFSTNHYYTSTSAGSIALPWGGPYDLSDVGESGNDFTGGWSLDWGAAGTCYNAVRLVPDALDILTSSDPTAGILFSPIGSGTYVPNRPFWGPGPAQPSIKVINVDNQDHIFVGFNDTSLYPGPTASVRYSLDGGVNWNTTLIEKTTPGAGWDAPAVRLALSGDGQTVYGLFQRVWSFSWNSDLQGDVVLMRDDGYGGSGYTGLGTGTLVAHNITIPYNYKMMGAQPLIGEDCDVAIEPARPNNVYVAYTEVVNNATVLRIQASGDSGMSFTPVYFIQHASHPSLAVASDGTVGLLYLLKNGNYLEVHFLKAFSGHFASESSDRVLAKFPNNNPVRLGGDSLIDTYLGDCWTLKAVNFNFFGVFSASGDPNPANFPNGVYYERNVLVGGTVMNNFWLGSAGTLIGLTGSTVAPSIDPFFFYDIAGSFRGYNVRYKPKAFRNDGDPLWNIDHLVWPVLPPDEPQLQLFTSSSLGPGAVWSPHMANAFENNGQFEAAFVSSQPQAFFRLQQDLTGAQFQLFTAAGRHGTLSPSGVVPVPATGNMVFTANADTNYAVGQWYVDGVAAQTGGSTLTLSNITAEHTLTVTFVPSNDLAVSLWDFPLIAGPTVTSGTNVYEVSIQNQGLNPLDGITLSDALPAAVAFISATSSQGTVINSGGTVQAELGALGPGATATVDITFVPLASGSITDQVTVACNQFEPDLSNNTATDVTTVIDPVTITNQPVSLIVPTGGTASFSVGASGTAPLNYQWLFNGNSIPGKTGPTLVLRDVGPAQAGSYSAVVSQPFGLRVLSDSATLTVGP